MSRAIQRRMCAFCDVVEKLGFKDWRYSIADVMVVVVYLLIW
jgi:hypothetical protein